jgi:broad specificity phosphatase PhoE
MRAGRFGNTTSLVLVTHGITLRVLLMRWFQWSVENFLQAGGAGGGGG